MADTRELVKVDGQWQIKGRPRETFKILGHYRPSNIPGKSLIVGLVEMPPGSSTPPHTHGGAAVLGLVLGGEVTNQMNTSAPFNSTPGEVFFEAPGCHHVRGDNASETEAAKFYAVFVVDDEIIKDGYAPLVVLDADKAEKAAM